MAQKIVILGGSYAGLHIAHYLLKKNDVDLKVILVSKNSHFYWNMASVRAVVPGQIQSEELLQPLVQALSRYPRERWDLVIGTAERADFAAKTVTLSSSSGTDTLSYDQLVLATGSRCPDTNVPWKANDTYDSVLSHLRQTVERVQTASHIVVAGAGATGVELAGELVFEYGKTKEVMLLCSGDKLLGGDSVGVAAEAELRKLKVVIRKDSYVADVNTRPDGKTEVMLRGGGPPIVTDLYLPTMGMVPNSEYIDARYLTTNKTVDVDEYFRVKDLDNVWACGDIVSKPRSGFLITQKHAGSVAKNIETVLKGGQPLVVKDPPDIFSCAVGRSRGAGRFNSFKLPSLGVWLAKGRTLGVPMMSSYMTGSIA